MESQKHQLNFVEKTIFASRFLLVPMYVGLIVVQLAYATQFLVQSYSLVLNFWHMDETELMLAALSLVDMVMIANLISMVTIGSHSSFVNELPLGDSRKPQWLKHISSGVLKVKIGTSLIGVSSVHLLRSFINPPTDGWNTLGKQLAIHGAFIVASLILVLIEYISHRDDHHLEVAHQEVQVH